MCLSQYILISSRDTRRRSVANDVQRAATHSSRASIELEQEEEGTPLQNVGYELTDLGTTAKSTSSSPKDRPRSIWIVLNERFKGNIRQSRFYGWRMGVLLGSCTSAFVLTCNIAMIIVGARTRSGYDREGVATLLTADEETISRWNTLCHIFINVLSTILLSASNYTMQVLNSPTRYELDLAHAGGKWLDIGLVSFHNLRIISRKRAAICIVIAASSLPLHLL